MPRGKELEQLPMSNISAPSIGDDGSKFNRTNLSGITREERPSPSKVGKEVGKTR
ncbi:hypothetical protein [Niallia endozanthoxylica]|uniref:hypothetical protein n=1 Tax=Niallia endozanthoxylica TaxID=2036016 RepID=UPI00168A8588|nr:hypothetical protein [Niallia endozanthoxylica]